MKVTQLFFRLIGMGLATYGAIIWLSFFRMLLALILINRFNFDFDWIYDATYLSGFFLTVAIYYIAYHRASVLLKLGFTKEFGKLFYIHMAFVGAFGLSIIVLFCYAILHVNGPFG